MTIFAIPDLPKMARARLRKLDNSLHQESVFTKASQTRVFPGARWWASYTLPPLNDVEARPWVTFLLSLRGRANRFYAYDTDHRVPAGVATGTPLVAGASQTGATLATDGWTPNTPTIMKAGDYIAFDTSKGRELRAVIADASSDGAGAASLSLDEPIRTSPADNQALILTDPSCIMVLDQDFVGWDTDKVGIYGITFQGKEAYGP